jgi:hypothetical protein
MESILAGMFGGGEVGIILTLIMALAAIGVASLVVIAVSLWRRNQTGTKDAAVAGRSPSR